MSDNEDVSVDSVLPWWELPRSEFLQKFQLLIPSQQMMMDDLLTELKKMVEKEPDGFEISWQKGYLTKRYKVTDFSRLDTLDLKGLVINETETEIKFSCGTPLTKRLSELRNYQQKRREQQERQRRGSDS